MSVEVIDCSGFSLDGVPEEKTSEITKVERQEQKHQKLQNDVMKQVLTKQKKTPENIKEHQEHVLMLSRYGTSERFSKYLKGLSFDLAPNKLKKMELEELKELLQRVRTSINNKNTTGVFQEFAIGGVQMIEGISVNTALNKKIKIKGLSKALQNDHVFMDLLEQIQLENQNLAYVSPYTRLVYTILMTSMRIHSINILIEKQTKPQHADNGSIKPEDKDDVIEFDDHNN